MGARGPKAGFRKVAGPSATVAPQRAPEQPRAPAPSPAAAPEALSSSDRINPNKLTGEALRELAYRRGIPRSTAADLSDTKIREQLRYIDARQYEDA